jgi:hypothetical protein
VDDQNLTKWQKHYRKYKHVFVKFYKTPKGKASNLRKHYKYRETHPWFKTYMAIRCRMRHPTKCYIGIKNFLKPKDLKFLWFRDKAFLLSRPSIDRYDSKGDYTIENCHYIELSDNSKEAMYRRHTKEGHNVKRIFHHHQ